MNLPFSCSNYNRQGYKSQIVGTLGGQMYNGKIGSAVHSLRNTCHFSELRFFVNVTEFKIIT